MHRSPTKSWLWLLCGPVLALSACSPSRAESTDVVEEEESIPLVRLAAVELRDVRREIETTGFLESEHRVTVLSKVPGRVLSVPVDAGDRVTAGQELAVLDSSEAEAVVKTFATQLEDRKVRANLAELEVDSAKQREEQAIIDRDQAQAAYDRLAKQHPDDIARNALEDATFALESAKKAATVAGFEHRKAQLDHLAATNAITEYEARLEEAETRLREHTIVAPFDGNVVSRQISGGETISSATELFDVVDLEHLVTYLSRPQIQLPLVRNAKEVVFTADAYGEREFVADVDMVSPVVDAETGHFKIRARVRPEDTEVLQPGMFIRTRILTEDSREALMVPKSAVLAEGDRSIVFAVREGRAFKIVLDPGFEDATHIECLNRGDGGLSAEDAVVTAGHDDLRDQAEVEVSEEG